MLDNLLFLCFLVLSAQSAKARFSQADTWAGQQTQPITLNKYTYAHDDPVAFTDLSGYSPDGLMRDYMSKVLCIESCLDRYLKKSSTITVFLAVSGSFHTETNNPANSEYNSNLLSALNKRLQ